MVDDRKVDALHGLKAVELTRDPAGEFVGKLLGGFHAEVLKVELPEGHRPVGSGRSSGMNRTSTSR
jgi:crotonobetainyl-CoA:carnitine CoA-transferase CaiB-like acyl-CoA transferase